MSNAELCKTVSFQGREEIVTTALQQTHRLQKQCSYSIKMAQNATY